MNCTKECSECVKLKERSSLEKKELKVRLNKIEGQVRGIKQMVEDNRYCDDILIQLVAVNKSIKSLGNKLLKTHMKSCVVEELKNGNVEIIDDIMHLFGRFN